MSLDRRITRRSAGTNRNQSADHRRQEFGSNVRVEKTNARRLQRSFAAALRPGFFASRPRRLRRLRPRLPLRLPQRRRQHLPPTPAPASPHHRSSGIHRWRDRAAEHRSHRAETRAAASSSAHPGRDRTTPTAAGHAAAADPPEKRVAGANEKFDEARRALVAPAGANSYQLNQQALEALPQGTNTPLDKALLQVPGVSQDSAASGDLHVRNEHANLQYRINGIMLPDGVGAFGQIIDTGIVGSLALITGALPAQYGLRTAGVLDIQTKTDAFNNSGSVSVYGGSHGNITTSAEYGGTVGQTQYYVSGRYFGSSVGIENPTPAYNAIHDNTSQEKGFLYLSTVIDPTSRLTLISGVSNGAYQIPNNPGQTPAFTPFGITSFDSALLNERQQEFNQFNVLAYQKSIEGFDFQLSYFNRYSSLHFMPDPIGDLVFNGVASDVYRQSFINGIQEDTSYRIGFAHTLKFGFSTSAENSLVNNGSTALLLDPGTGSPTDTHDFGVRFQHQDRLPLQHLSRGRMEGHQQPDHQCRPALRPDVAIRRRQPAQPAHQRDLEAV